MKVLILGDSHAAALKRGKQLLNAEKLWPADIDLTVHVLGPGNILAKPFYRIYDDRVEVVDATYQSRLPRLPLTEVADPNILYGICAPLHTARVWRREEWNRFAPSDVARHEVPITQALLKRVIMDDQKYMLAFIDFFRRLDSKVFVIEAPYPFRHHPALKTTRSEVVSAINREYRKLIKKELADRSVPVVSVPGQCVDDDGFMNDKYRHELEEDEHHAGGLFGRLMMSEILSFLRPAAA
ncbi:MAG: hypothetical protein ACU837_02910 [Gammaproteobacteria bacterium]